MIRINLLRDRRVRQAPAEEPAGRSTPPVEAAPAMGVGFDAGAPEEYYPSLRRGLNAFKLALLVSGALIAGMIIWSFLAGSVADEAQAELDAVQAQAAQLKESTADLAALQQQHADLAARVEALTVLTRPDGPDDRYLALLSDINNSVPERDAWLLELRERKGSVSLKGDTYSDQAVAEILDRMLKSARLSAVKPLGAKSADLAGSKVLQFEFSARLD